MFVLAFDEGRAGNRADHLARRRQTCRDNSNGQRLFVGDDLQGSAEFGEIDCAHRLQFVDEQHDGAVVVLGELSELTQGGSDGACQRCVRLGVLRDRANRGSCADRVGPQRRPDLLRWAAEFVFNPGRLFGEELSERPAGAARPFDGRPPPLGGDVPPKVIEQRGLACASTAGDDVQEFFSPGASLQSEQDRLRDEFPPRETGWFDPVAGVERHVIIFH